GAAWGRCRGPPAPPDGDRVQAGARRPGAQRHIGGAVAGRRRILAEGDVVAVRAAGIGGEPVGEIVTVGTGGVGNLADGNVAAVVAAGIGVKARGDIAGVGAAGIGL